MKIDPNQGPPPAGPSAKPDAAAAPGSTGPARSGTDAPLASPFQSLLRKGKKGEGESLKSGEGGDPGVFTDMPESLTGPEGKGLEGKNPEGKGKNPEGKTAEGKGPFDPREILKPGDQADPTARGPQRPPREGKNPLHLPHRGPVSWKPDQPVDPRAGNRSISARADLPSAPRTEKAPVAAPLFQPEAPAIRTVTNAAPVVGEVHAAGSTAEAERVQALTNEIVDKIQASKGPGGDDRVDIQFNSRTLQGLQVSISRNDAGVSIRFQTGSDPVSQLLSQNSSSLVQALAARGVQVSDVTVVPNTPPSSESFTGGRSRQDSRQDSRQGSRGDSDSGAGGGGGSSGNSGGRGGQRGGR